MARSSQRVRDRIDHSPLTLPVPKSYVIEYGHVSSLTHRHLVFYLYLQRLRQRQHISLTHSAKPIDIQLGKETSSLTASLAPSANQS